MGEMKLYKVLGENGEAVNGGQGKWHLPTKEKDGTWKPGEWMPTIKGDLTPCQNGYHLCRRQDIIDWINESIYEAEYQGEIIEDSNKVIVRKARLLSKFESWGEKTAILFAADCAERTLHIFEKQYPNDERPRKAITASRNFAFGDISKKELAAAGASRDAAGAAARDAEAAAAGAARDAEAASRDVAGAAARDAAWAAAAAAGAAAGAAWMVANDATWAAVGAAWDAEAAARDTAGAAARDAAGAAEKTWQTKRLFYYLLNKESK